MLTEGGRSDRYGYVIQCNAAGERRLTNRCQCRRQSYSLQIITILERVIWDCGNALRHSEAYQFDAAFEDIAAIPSADRCPTRRNIDRCKLLAVGKCPVSDCSDAVRQNNALQRLAAIKGIPANDSQTVRKRDCCKAGAACERMLTEGGRSDRYGYVIQCNAAGERRLTNRCQCRRQSYSLQIITILERVIWDCGNALRHSKACQLDAAFENIAAVPNVDCCPVQRNVDG